MPLLLFTSRQDHVVEPVAERIPGGALRRPRRSPLAGAQLPRGDTGLRSRHHLPRHHRVRPQGHRVSVRPRATFARRATSRARRRARWTIGPLSLNAYGLMIALGVIAGVWLFGRRLEQKGIGTRDDANAIAIWGVLAGVVGARLYHVITDWERFDGNYGDIVKIWEGGLGIPGGMLAGVLVGAYVGHVRRGIPLGPGLNAVAPALAPRPGDRPVGQLLQPGAVRSPDRPALGVGGRCRDGAGGGLPAGHDVPPDVPLRVAVQLRAVRDSCSGSTSGSTRPAGACWRCTCSATASSGSGSKACASTRPTSSARSAGTSGSPSPASSAVGCT